MGKISEVYTYTRNNSFSYNQTSSSVNTLGIKLDTIYGTESTYYILYDNQNHPVGKIFLNEFVSQFQDKTSLYSTNLLLSFEDTDESYILFLLSYKTPDKFIKKNKTLFSKSVGSGGKYVGKDVTITLKTDETATRKIILEYENSTTQEEHQHTSCRSSQEDISSVLTNLNTKIDNFWTDSEIISVSNKLSNNAFFNLIGIVEDGLLKPLGRKFTYCQATQNMPVIEVKSPIIKYYSLKNYDPEQGILYSTKILHENRLQLQENIIFCPTLIPANKKENISQLLYETFTIKNEIDDNMLSAIGFYFDESTSIISTVESANYAVIGSTGNYDGAKRVKIEFFNDKEFLRKMTIYFE